MMDVKEENWNYKEVGGGERGLSETWTTTKNSEKSQNFIEDINLFCADVKDEVFDIKVNCDTDKTENLNCDNVDDDGDKNFCKFINELKKENGIMVKSEPSLDLGVDVLDVDVDVKKLTRNHGKKRKVINEKKGSSSSSQHQPSTTYRCFTCSYESKKRGLFSRHVFRHLGVKPHHCQQCNQKFTELCDLKRHIVKVHTHMAEIVENLTNFNYLTKTSDRSTIDCKIMKNNENRIKNKSIKKFPCDLCDYMGQSNNDVIKHRFIHGLERPYACTFCSYKCCSTSDLVKHFTSHSDYRPYECYQCDYKAKRLAHLRSHMKIHLKRLWPCKRCEYKTKSKHRLAGHVKKKHSSQIYKQNT